MDAGAEKRVISDQISAIRKQERDNAEAQSLLRFAEEGRKEKRKA